MNRLRRSLIQRLRSLLVLSSVLLWVFIGEFGPFWVYSLRWGWPTAGSVLSNNASCLNKNGPPYCYSPMDDAFFFPEPRQNDSSRRPKTELKMLIFSDLHIMCSYNDELWIARFDADRYLRQSFSYVMSTLGSSPDVVVLLGDVFSNGFRASEQQWEDYLNCLKKIVSLPPSIQLIVILGDNDIGGEGQDLMTDVVMRRYKENFGPFNDIISYKEHQFVKLTTVCYLNNILKTTSEKKCRHDLDEFLQQKTNSNFQPSHVIFSHVPLNYLSPATRTNGHSMVNIKSRILSSLVGTQFIFSGHIHHAMFSEHSTPVSKGRESIQELANDKVVHEITVPTCSYRMGERHMGVGAAVLNQGSGLVYKVLWLPPRYPVLISYLLMLILLALLLVGHVFSCKFYSPLCGR